MNNETGSFGARNATARASQFMAKAPKTAIEIRHGTSGSHRKSRLAGSAETTAHKPTAPNPKSAPCRHQSTDGEKRASNGAGTCSIPSAPATIRVDTKARPRVFG